MRMKEIHWKDRGKALWRESRGLMLTILILTAVRSAIADWNDVPSGSMNPTIVEGDRVFVNKLAYDLKVPFTRWHLAQWSNPKRGDIAVFFSPADGIRLVKRVIGLPGDTVEMIDDRLLINGVPAAYGRLPESVGRDLPATRMGPRYFVTESAPDSPVHALTLLPRVRAKRPFGPVKVLAGHYFMMGDNRDDSNDSRYWGTVDRSQIVGRASMVMMSLDHQHYFEPRWHRFFTELL
jgi:signal peptidase I